MTIIRCCRKKKLFECSYIASGENWIWKKLNHFFTYFLIKKKFLRWRYYIYYFLFIQYSYIPLKKQKQKHYPYLKYYWKLNKQFRKNQIVACDLFKILDKVCIHTSFETIIFYKNWIKYFVLSGKNNSMLILNHKSLFLIIKIIVKLRVIYIRKGITYLILS